MQIKEDSGLPEDSSWLHDHSRLLNKGCCWLAGVLREAVATGREGRGRRRHVQICIRITFPSQASGTGTGLKSPEIC